MPVKKTTKKVVKEKKQALNKAINEQLDRHYESGIVNTYTSQGDIDLDIPPVKDWEVTKIEKHSPVCNVCCGECWKESINYWKYALISILLGIVVAMIFSTPHVIKALEVCTNQ